MTKQKNNFKKSVITILGERSLYSVATQNFLKRQLHTAGPTFLLSPFPTIDCLPPPDVNIPFLEGQYLLVLVLYSQSPWQSNLIIWS